MADTPDNLLQQLSSSRFVKRHSAHAVFGDPSEVDPEEVTRQHKPLTSDVLGMFELQEKLGEGSFATTYLAKQRGLERVAVVKITHPHLIEGPHEALIRDRFDVEIRAATRLNHPNLAVIYTSGEVEGLPALAMEYVQGPTLERWLAQRGRLNEELCARVFGQLADVLAALHREGIVHRDVSPANIIIERADSTAPQPKLLDFGVARMDNTPNATAGPIGTPDFMAPEQLFGESSAASDVFSLGSLMWLALTGELLLGKHTTQQGTLRQLQALNGTADPRRFVPRLTPQLAELVRAMLQPDPAARPTSAQVTATLQRLHTEALNVSGEYRSLTPQLHQTPSQLQGTFSRGASAEQQSWSRVVTRAALRVLLLEDPQLPLNDRLSLPEGTCNVTTRQLNQRPLDGSALGSVHVLMIPLLPQHPMIVGLLRRLRTMIEMMEMDVQIFLYSFTPTPTGFWLSAGADAVWILPDEHDQLNAHLSQLQHGLPQPHPLATSTPAPSAEDLGERIERFIGTMPEWLLELEEAVDDRDRTLVIQTCIAMNRQAASLNLDMIVALSNQISQLPLLDYGVRGERLVTELFDAYRDAFNDLAEQRRLMF